VLDIKVEYTFKSQYLVNTRLIGSNVSKEICSQVKDQYYSAIIKN